MLEFWHYYNCEANYDGGNVKISTNGGSTWNLLTPEGGYPASNLSVLNGPGYCGNSNGWIIARFNLSNYANQNVQFRFTIASDTSINGPGWFIDDVRTTGYVEFASKVSGTVVVAILISIIATLKFEILLLCLPILIPRVVIPFICLWAHNLYGQKVKDIKIPRLLIWLWLVVLLGFNRISIWDI
jgi:hypothetical protein